MAYSTSNPPYLIAQGGAGGRSIWAYFDGDASTDIDAAGYFTDGYDRGMRPGDLLFAVDTDTFAAALMVCNAGTSNATLDFNDGTAIASTDSD